MQLADDLQTLLALLLAHVLGDFLLQGGATVRGKIAGDARAFLRHGTTHVALAVAALALFTSAPLFAGRTLLGLSVLALGHVALDVAKASLIRRRPLADGTGLFVADQLAHLAIVGIATLCILTRDPALHERAWLLFVAHSDRVLLTAVIYAAFVFPSGYLIRYLLGPLSRELEDGAERPQDETAAGLVNAGLYLGWLERALVIAAFAEGSLAAVGLIVGAKSVARFPEFQSRAFAEYFLIGTLLSVSIAAVGGWLLRALL